MGRPGFALVIVPHRRPWRYFADLFAREKKACVLPKMLAFSEVVDIWSASQEKTAPYVANRLDQVALLRECARSLAADDQKLAARLSQMDMAGFLPWGMRLAGLLEEMFTQGLAARDLANLEGEVAEPAAALLEALGRISQAWKETLVSRHWTTPGFNHYKALSNAASVPALFLPRDGRPVFIAGFSSLNGAEDAIFKSLWQKGAHVCLHSDPELAQGGRIHWACETQREWLRRWRASATLAHAMEPGEKTARPSFFFFGGYDVHSQLKEMAGVLAKSDSSSTAVALANEKLLMPVLHHLPSKDVNVSMGYPLSRTPLRNLIDLLFSALEGRSGAGHYYWRDLLKLFRLPYLNMLGSQEGTNASLRKAFSDLDKAIRQGERYVDLASLWRNFGPGLSGETAELMRKCFDLFLLQFSSAATLRELAINLERICGFLIQKGGDIWSRFPLDAEAMTRLLNNALPVLRENAMADVEFPLPVMRRLLNMLLDEERVPFEADPLVGIQILGMLETRLLNFDRLLIMDATDDILPGNLPQDPLLPDSLRGLLGLPDAREREKVAAYNLFRLCAGAREVFFFWQEGVNHSGLLEGKKIRSRFVEQIIWTEEQKRKAILNPGEPPLAMARASVVQKARQPRPIRRDAALDKKIAEFLARRISATALNDYLRCPLAFAYKRLLAINPLAEITEGDDPAAVGNCIHKTLYLLYQPFLDRKVAKSDINGKIDAIFKMQLTAENLQDTLPADSFLMLKTAGPVRLKKFIKAQPDSTFIVALEKKIDSRLAFNGDAYNFTGIIDRLDRRKGKLHLLDYKTGAISTGNAGLWKNEIFFAKLRAFIQDPVRSETAARSLLAELRQDLPSLQLPCYLAMLEDSNPGDVANAAFVDLYDSGNELPLFGELEEKELAAALGHCKTVLAFVLAALKSSSAFEPNQDRHCSWCAYSGLCL